MSGQTIILRGQSQRDLAKQRIDEAKDDARVLITETKEARTSAQNRTIHMWFGQVAKHSGDWDATEVKGFCHRQWGLPIKMRCAQFSWIWERTGSKMPYEKQCKLLASGVLNVSSSMSVEELSEYMEAMSRHYRSEGVYLTDPEAAKYEGVLTK